MKHLISTLLPLMIVFISCAGNQTDALVIEPAGSADYYINNQSSSDLSVVFVTSPELGSKTDSSVVAVNRSLKILDDGIIGVNPRPEDSISKLTFYNPERSTEPVFIFDPVTNGEWDVIGTDFDETGYGLTKYQLTITDSTLD